MRSAKLFLTAAGKLVRACETDQAGQRHADHQRTFRRRAAVQVRSAAAKYRVRGMAAALALDLQNGRWDRVREIVRVAGCERFFATIEEKKTISAIAPLADWLEEQGAEFAAVLRAVTA